MRQRVAHRLPRSDTATETASTPYAASLASTKEKIAALQPNFLALSRRLCRALEPTPREARYVNRRSCVALCTRTAKATRCCCAHSRQREIEQVEAQVSRLAKMQLREPAVAAGLEPLTDEQLQLATDALGPGLRSEVLASKVFKCAWPPRLVCCNPAFTLRPRACSVRRSRSHAAALFVYARGRVAERRGAG